MKTQRFVVRGKQKSKPREIILSRAFDYGSAEKAECLLGMFASRVAFPALDEQAIPFLFICGNFDGAGLLYAKIRPHTSNLSKAFAGGHFRHLRIWQCQSAVGNSLRP